MPQPSKAELLLDRVIKDAAPLAIVGAVVPRAGEDDYDVALVATALVRVIYVQAVAAQAVSRTEEPEGASPNIRSAFEGLGELSYLLEQDSQSRARIASTFAQREPLEHLTESGSDPDGALNVRTELDRRQTEMPVEYAIAMEPKRRYWTDLSRRGLVEHGIAAVSRTMGQTLRDGLGKEIYKLLSWDDHHIMATITAIDTYAHSPTVGQIKRPGIVDEPADFIREQAALALGGALRLYRQQFPRTSASAPSSNV